MVTTYSSVAGSSSISLRERPGQDRDPGIFKVLIGEGQAVLHLVVHVGKEPDVGRRVQLELFDDQPSGAGRRAPVDAAKAVSRFIVAHAGDVGGDIVRSLAHGVAAGKLAQRRHKRGHREHGRVDDNVGGRLQFALEPERGPADRRTRSSSAPGQTCPRRRQMVRTAQWRLRLGAKAFITWLTWCEGRSNGRAPRARPWAGTRCWSR